MATLTGKHALAQMLIAEGVEYIFGNPGTSETPLLDVLQDYPQLKYIQALQEGTAVGMADGYARATGRPAFANYTHRRRSGQRHQRTLQRLPGRNTPGADGGKL